MALNRIGNAALDIVLTYSPIYKTKLSVTEACRRAGLGPQYHQAVVDWAFFHWRYISRDVFTQQDQALVQVAIRTRDAAVADGTLSLNDMF